MISKLVYNLQRSVCYIYLAFIWRSCRRLRKQDKDILLVRISWCCKVKPLRWIVSFWSVMELRFSLFCRNLEHQGCLSFNGLPIIVLNFFQMCLSLYLSVLSVYVPCVQAMWVCQMFVPCLCATCVVYPMCTIFGCVVSLCVPCLHVYQMCLVPVEIRRRQRQSYSV